MAVAVLPRSKMLWPACDGLFSCPLLFCLDQKCSGQHVMAYLAVRCCFASVKNCSGQHVMAYLAVRCRFASVKNALASM
jgi:hypothetical protein